MFNSDILDAVSAGIDIFDRYSNPSGMRYSNALLSTFSIANAQQGITLVFVFGALQGAGIDNQPLNMWRSQFNTDFTPLVAGCRVRAVQSILERTCTTCTKHMRCWEKSCSPYTILHTLYGFLTQFKLGSGVINLFSITRAYKIICVQNHSINFFLSASTGMEVFQKALSASSRATRLVGDDSTWLLRHSYVNDA